MKVLYDKEDGVPMIVGDFLLPPEAIKIIKKYDRITIRNLDLIFYFFIILIMICILGGFVLSL